MSDLKPGWAEAGGKALAELERQGAEFTDRGKIVRRGRWSETSRQASSRRGAAKGNATRNARLTLDREMPLESDTDEG